MNLLQQLAGFCQTSVSFNFIDSPTNISTDITEEKPQPRSVSLFANHKLIDSRQSKSIEKIKNWVPISQKQIKQRKLLKFSRTIQKKVRNTLFHFWVNFQHVAKSRKQGKKSQKIELGCQKLSEFIMLQNSKNNANMRINTAFSKIKRYSSKVASLEMLQNSLKNSILKQKAILFKNINYLDKISVHLSLFGVVCNNLQRKGLIDTFCKIKHHQQVHCKVQNALNIQSTKQIDTNKRQSKITVSHQVQDVLFSKVINIKNNKHKALHNIKIEQVQIMLFEESEMTSMPLSKALGDSAYENFPQICDNVLFFEKPNIQETQQKISYSTIKTANKEQIEERLTKTRRSFSKPENTYVPYRSPLNQINLLQGQLTMKKQYETPREKTPVSLLNIFNVDQSRIEKLEKKIFGQTQKKQNKYSMDGQVWRSDRETLAEIMSSLKSPSISRRNSTQELELEKIRQKIVGYQIKQEAKQKIKQSEYLMKTNKSSINIKRQKQISIGTMNDQLTQTRKFNKITVSLKCKKKNSTDMSLMNTPNAKQREWKKFNQDQPKSKAKIIQN